MVHPRVIHNGRLVERARAVGPLVSPAALYGRGVFTTLAVHHGRPFLWREHWARLMEHAARAGVRTEGFEEEGVLALLSRLIEANEVTQGRARLTLLARVGGGVWEAAGEEAQPATDLLIMTGEPYPAGDDDGGPALTISPHRVNTLSPLAGVKSVNYLEPVLAREEARSRDFDEAVRLNERGEVVSAAMANIFWVTGGTVHTPGLSTGALAGTTRAQVIRLAGELSVPHVEGVYDLSDLGDADEIFLTDSGHGIRIVTTFDFHRYTVPVGSVAIRLREALRQMMIVVSNQ